MKKLLILAVAVIMVFTLIGCTAKVPGTTTSPTVTVTPVPTITVTPVPTVTVSPLPTATVLPTATPKA